MKLLDDTSPEAWKVLVNGYRRMPLDRRWQIMEDAYNTARILHEMGFRKRNPYASPESVRVDWGTVTLGPLARTCPLNLEGIPIDPQSLANLTIIRVVMAQFRHRGIPCALGGSWASSTYGIPRLTHDADVTSAPFPGKEMEFVGGFGQEYYLDVDSVRQAIRNRASFNIIHTITNFKVDVFIQKARPFDQFILARRVAMQPPNDPGDPIEFLTPEDIILLKLEYFRIGGEISDRQWGDILGVLRNQGDRLDFAYLEFWAGQLKVADLLQKVREQL